MIRVDLQKRMSVRHPSEGWDPEKTERLDSSLRWNDEVGMVPSS